MRVHGRRIASSLLPYALASVAVVLASTIAIATAIRPGSVGPAAPLASAEPTPTPRAAAAPDARMAYWRAAATGLLELWVSDLDGDHRARIATAGADTDLALTRWSPDGSAVAYTVGGSQIGIARLDGTSSALPLGMPAQLRQARWRIVSFEWSPDAKRIAATFRAGGGLSNESDVYVAEARSSALWDRVTTLGDAFAGRWIDGDRLFVETSSGMIAVLDLSSTGLRPITGMPATSPIVGRDGRVYFTGGRSVVADVTTQPVASGWVWSTTIDGDDLRRETAAEQTQARIFGLLADGRAVTGVPGGVYFAADTLVPLAFVGSGTVRRVVVSDDGRRVIGITDSRILQIDAARVPRTIAPGGLPPASAATTLLSGLRDADVWAARKAVPLARAIGPSSDGPRARLAFTLGRAVWQADPDGALRLVLAEPSGLISPPFISPPTWSPSGDRIAVSVAASPGAGRSAVAVVGPNGVRRWDVPVGFAPSIDWTPDGTQVAVRIPAGSRLDEWTTQLYDAETGRAAERVAGRLTWIGGQRVVLTDGELEPIGSPPPSGTTPLAAVRSRQRIELVKGTARGTITDASRIGSSPPLRDLPDARLIPVISGIFPSGEPAYLGALVTRARQGGIGSSAFVVLRVSDGEPVYALALGGVLGGAGFALPRPAPLDPSFPSWAPAGHLLGWTVEDSIGPGGTTVRRAVVVDPLTGRTLIRAEGRFAGWTADGTWAYVARDEGLYAYRADGVGDPVRVSPLGVIVAAAKP